MHLYLKANISIQESTLPPAKRIYSPLTYFIIKKGFTASVWGDFSTDDERVAYDRGNSGQQMYHSVGVGACLTF